MKNKPEHFSFKEAVKQKFKKSQHIVITYKSKKDKNGDSKTLFETDSSFPIPRTKEWLTYNREHYYVDFIQYFPQVGSVLITLYTRNEYAKIYE